MANNHFTLVVAGANPEGLLPHYDSNKKVAPYVVYEYNKAKEYRAKYIKIYEELLQQQQLSPSERVIIMETLEDYKAMDDIEFYMEMCDGYTMDETTYNAMSCENPDGKYSTCRRGKELCMPLINKKGETVFQEAKKNIDWSKIHFAGMEAYEKIWEMCVNGAKPSNSVEQEWYDNMKNRTAYFQTFGSKEKYVASNTAFWGYAFLSESTGWVEVSGKDNQYDWICNFYDRFIKPLPDDTVITIFECTRSTV